MFRRIALVGCLVLALGLATTPAQALHFFTTCAKGLQPAAGGATATVTVAGYSFTDQGSGSNKTQIAAGQSVTWTWGDIYCHSVTEGLVSGSGPRQLVPPAFTTRGTGANPLVSPEGTNNSFTTVFNQPGVYRYYCDHHVTAGMEGVVIVTAAVPAAPTGT
jgi:plastocyanin